jgi:hypothetical protein
LHLDQVVTPALFWRFGSKVMQEHARTHPAGFDDTASLEALANRL